MVRGWSAKSVVSGSTPPADSNGSIAQLAEHLTLNQRVLGSNPSGVTMNKEVRTIGELRELIKVCEDEEPISYILEEGHGSEKVKRYIVLDGISSTAGGRAVNLWFTRK